MDALDEQFNLKGLEKKGEEKDFSEFVSLLNKETDDITHTFEIECPILYDCSVIDADCIGNGKKFFGCHTLRDYISKNPSEFRKYFQKVSN